jgi:hypothetical protein
VLPNNHKQFSKERGIKDVYAGFTADASLTKAEPDYVLEHKTNGHAGNAVPQLHQVMGTGTHGPVVGSGCFCMDGYDGQGAFCIYQGRLL